MPKNVEISEISAQKKNFSGTWGHLEDWQEDCYNSAGIRPKKKTKTKNRNKEQTIKQRAKNKVQKTKNKKTKNGF